MTLDNLLSGLVGALLGLAGAFVLDWRRDRRDDQAAARAVFMEVRGDLAILNVVIGIGVFHPLSNSTWSESRSRLARNLSPSQFVVVAGFYLAVDGISGMNYATSGTPNMTLQAVSITAREHGINAAAVLLAHGWSKAGERDELEKTVLEVIGSMDVTPEGLQGPGIKKVDQ